MKSFKIILLLLVVFVSFSAIGGGHTGNPNISLFARNLFKTYPELISVPNEGDTQKYLGSMFFGATKSSFTFDLEVGETDEKNFWLISTFVAFEDESTKFITKELVRKKDREVLRILICKDDVCEEFPFIDDLYPENGLPNHLGQPTIYKNLPVLVEAGSFIADLYYYQSDLSAGEATVWINSDLTIWPIVKASFLMLNDENPSVFGMIEYNLVDYSSN